MRAIILVLLVAFSAAGIVHAQSVRKKSSGLDKVLRSVLQPRKPTTTPKPKPKPKSKRKAHIAHVTPKQSTKTLTVDYEWMARYWELETAWDYWIPEDDQIKFKDGKYIVPVVVFKHYEDMANTARRTPAAAIAVPPVSPFD